MHQALVFYSLALLTYLTAFATLAVVLGGVAAVVRWLHMPATRK